MKLTIEEIGYLEDLRRRLGLEEDDDSRDKEIEDMEPIERVRMLCGWHLGSESWADAFISYMTSQGLYITTNPEDENVLHDF